MSNETSGKRLAGKVAFITGAARGQGRAHAIRLAEEGADVVATDLVGPDEDSAFAETVGLVEAAGGRILAQAADVRHLDQLRAAAAAGRDRFGRLDVVVANAGVIRVAPTLELSAEDWALTLDVNLTGAFHTAQATLPHLIDGGNGGSVVLVSSTLGLGAEANTAAYASSKHGCVGLMRALAIEFAPQMIRVNSVHPTAVDTPMLQGLRPEGMDRDQLAAVCAQKNLLPVPWIEPEDVSNAIVFLASEEGRYLTGVALPVDAGALLVPPTVSVPSPVTEVAR